MHLRLLGLIGCLVLGHPVLAQQPAAPMPVTVATFNMAWAGTVADFKRHLEVCGSPSVNWCETRARWAPGTTQATPEEVTRANACQAATIDAAGGREASMLIAPCNAYRDSQPRLPGAPPPDLTPLRKPEAYQDKLSGLQATVKALVETENVRVIACQEGKSTDAVRAVLCGLSDKFDVCTAQHNGFQTLAFAWDTSLSSAKGVCTTHAPLAILDPPTDPAAFRRVRPGLALQLSVNGTPLTFMNVHLKAGCASVTNSNPRFPGRLLTDAVEPCEVFNRQVPIFESWIASVSPASPRFVILGDFNRRIDDEKALAVAKEQVRADGSDPASRHTVAADGRVSTRYLWPEIADSSRALFLLPLTATDADCKGFVGLDHIVVSASLHATLAQHKPAAIAARKVAVSGRAGQLIETSDHCPQLAQVLL